MHEGWNIWAMLFLSDDDAYRVREFFTKDVGVKPGRIIANPHLTVYHSRRPMPGLRSTKERASLILAAADTRFMVMYPGGENPRDELDPGKLPVGIRIRRKCETQSTLFNYRERCLRFETRRVLGSRPSSDHRTNAFGARSFQPHVTLLKAWSGIDRDLTKVGELFRSRFDKFTFDRFVIEIRPPKS